MAKLQLKAGTTSKTVKVFIQDTTGAALTGLAFGTSGLTAYFIREGAAASVAITLITATLGTWVSGGFIVVDGTNMPGLYELDLPDAALAAAAKSVVVYLQGAATMAPCVLEIELTAVDNQDTVRYGMTALPNAAANAAGGLPISAAGALDMDDIAADVDAIETTIGAAGVGLTAVRLSSAGLDSIVMSDITAVPSMTGTLKAAINWMYALMRNKRTETATVETLFKDDGSTSVATSTKSDSSGTFTRGEYS